MQQRTRTLFLIGAAAVLVLLLAAGLHDVVLRPGLALNLDIQWGLPTGIGAGPRQRVDLPGWLPAVAVVVLVLAGIAIVVSRSLRRDLMHNLPIYLLLLIGVFMMRDAVIQKPLPPVSLESLVARPAPQPGDLPATRVPDFVSHPPEWVVTALTLVLIAGVLALAWRMFRRIGRMRGKRTALSELVEEARGVLVDLQAGADLRDTITRCYTEMARLIKAQRGVTREISMTPREFEQHLAASGLGEVHIRRLTRLFERVRYGPHALGLAEEQEAEACLRAIVEAYQQH